MTHPLAGSPFAWLMTLWLMWATPHSLRDRAAR